MDDEELREYILNNYRYNRSRGQVSCPKSRESNGTIRVMILGKGYPLSNIVWLIEYGELPLKPVGHINEKRADNRWWNLALIDVGWRKNRGLKGIYKTTTPARRGGATV